MAQLLPEDYERLKRFAQENQFFDQMLAQYHHMGVLWPNQLNMIKQSQPFPCKDCQMLPSGKFICVSPHFTEWWGDVLEHKCKATCSHYRPREPSNTETKAFDFTSEDEGRNCLGSESLYAQQ